MKSVSKLQQAPSVGQVMIRYTQTKGGCMKCTAKCYPVMHLASVQHMHYAPNSDKATMRIYDMQLMLMMTCLCKFSLTWPALRLAEHKAWLHLSSKTAWMGAAAYCFVDKLFVSSSLIPCILFACKPTAGNSAVAVSVSRRGVLSIGRRMAGS